MAHGAFFSMAEIGFESVLEAVYFFVAVWPFALAAK